MDLLHDSRNCVGTFNRSWGMSQRCMVGDPLGQVTPSLFPGLLTGKSGLKTVVLVVESLAIAP